MAQTPSTMLPLGTPVPEFALVDAVSGRTVRSSDFQGAPGLLVMFICNHCPFVVHIRPELTRFAKDVEAKGLKLLAINSNSEESHPQDGPPHMKTLAQSEGWTFPFAFDADQSVAKAFQAACTPDFFLFDREGKLAYRGQFDSSRPGNGVPVTGKDLRAAVDAVLAGAPVPPEQRPSIGCNIKWKPGNAPSDEGAR